MKTIAIVILFALSLMGTELDSMKVNPDAYVIQVATVKNKTTALSILQQFPQMNTYIAMVEPYVVLYVVNLKSMEDGKKKLEKIHAAGYKDAYISKLTKKIAASLIRFEDIEPGVLKAQLIDEDVDEYEQKIEKENQKLFDKARAKKLAIEREKKELDNDPLFQADREKGFTLIEAIIQSLNNNYKLKASMEIINQAKYKLEEKEGANLPLVDLSGNTGYEARTARSGDLDPNHLIADINYQYKKRELYLSITENLWSGGKISGDIGEQDYKLRAALYDYRYKMETATLDVMKAYFDVVYAEIAVKISKKNMLSYQKILDIVKIKEENGAATKGDVNFIQANVDNAKAALVNTKAKLSNAMAKYVYLMQDVKDENMPFETGVIVKTENLEDSLAYMRENNALILRQKAYIQASANAMKAQDAVYYPTIDFSVNAQTIDNFDKGTGKRNKVNALITFNYNLYRGGSDEAKYLSKFARNNELKYALEDKKRKLIYDIKVIHRAVSATESSMELTKNEVVAARKVVESYWIAFKHGNQDLQALQLAQRNLNRSEIDYINYKKNLIISDFKLKKNTGELLKYLHIINLKGREF